MSGALNQVGSLAQCARIRAVGSGDKPGRIESERVGIAGGNYNVARGAER